MYCKLKKLVGSLIILIVAAACFTGCVNTELKTFSGKKRECFEPTDIGDRLSWGTRFVQNTPILPGTVKFKFDLDSLTTGEPLPDALRFTFTHKNRRGGVLFTQAWDIMPRDDGSIPFTTVNLGGVTVKKKEVFLFDLSPLDRPLPRSDFVFTWRYRAFEQNEPAEHSETTSGPAGLIQPVQWFKLVPNEHFRESQQQNAR